MGSKYKIRSEWTRRPRTSRSEDADDAWEDAFEDELEDEFAKEDEIEVFDPLSGYNEMMTVDKRPDLYSGYSSLLPLVIERCCLSLYAKASLGHSPIFSVSSAVSSITCCNSNSSRLPVKPGALY